MVKIVSKKVVVITMKIKFAVVFLIITMFLSLTVGAAEPPTTVIGDISVKYNPTDETYNISFDAVLSSPSETSVRVSLAEITGESTDAEILPDIVHLDQISDDDIISFKVDKSKIAGGKLYFYLTSANGASDSAVYDFDLVTLTNVGFAIKTGTGTNDNEKQGIRYSAQINKDARDLIAGDDFVLNEYGVLAKYSDNENDLVYTTTDNEERIGVSASYKSDGTIDVARRETETDIIFASSVVEIEVTEDNCNYDYIFTSYCVLSDADGRKIYLYGGEYTRSIYEVALQVKDAGESNAFIDSIVAMGEN
jgi:hypothetical protein